MFSVRLRTLNLFHWVNVNRYNHCDRRKYEVISYRIKTDLHMKQTTTIFTINKSNWYRHSQYIFTIFTPNALKWLIHFLQPLDILL